MAAMHGSPAGRRALGEMPVNIFGTPTYAKGSTIVASTTLSKHDANSKRGIDEVDKVEEPPTSRIRTSREQPRQYLFLQEDPQCSMEEVSKLRSLTLSCSLISALY